MAQLSRFQTLGGQNHDANDSPDESVSIRPCHPDKRDAVEADLSNHSLDDLRAGRRYARSAPPQGPAAPGGNESTGGCAPPRNTLPCVLRLPPPPPPTHPPASPFTPFPPSPLT